MSTKKAYLDVAKIHLISIICDNGLTIIYLTLLYIFLS